MSDGAAGPAAALGDAAAARLTGVLRWVHMTHLVDFMILMPLAPQLLRTLDLPAAALGQLVFVYTLGAGVAGLVLGAVIHRFERRALLLAVYAGFALAVVFTALAPSLPALLGARVLAGACGGVLSSLIQGTVAEHVALERRAAALGTVMTGHALASVIGVPLGLAIASALDWRLAFAALVAVVAPVLFAVARSVPRLPPRATPAAHGESAGALLRLAPAFVLTFAVSGSAYAVGAYFAPFWAGNVGVGEAGLPFVYFAAGALSLFTSPLIGRLADHHGRLEVFVVATLVSIAGILLVTRSGPLPVWLAVALGAVFFITIYGRWIPALALLSELPRSEHRGGFLMINGVVTQLGMGVGALAAGAMIEFDPGGRLLGFERVGELAVAVSLLAIPLAWRLARSPR